MNEYGWDKLNSNGGSGTPYINAIKKVLGITKVYASSFFLQFHLRLTALNYLRSWIVVFSDPKSDHNMSFSFVLMIIR